MKASDQTEAMLLWWRRVGVDRLDLAVRRPTGAMIWHYALSPQELPLSWARAENVRQAEVYVRPARGYSWPLVFLDDVSVALATATARTRSSLVVRTSAAGGCHLWIACDRALDESARRQAQRWLAMRTGADPASVSGEHLGRLAGFKNWKRGGCWVNVLQAAHESLWDPSSALGVEPDPATTRRQIRPGPDRSPSGRDWAWACRALELGRDPATVEHELTARAEPRRGGDAPRYARRTVRRAQAHTSQRPEPHAQRLPRSRFRTREAPDAVSDELPDGDRPTQTPHGR